MKKGRMPLWEKLLIMVLFITMVIAIIGGVFSWASNNASDENKLKLSDWLVATCSVIALAGTLILSCITITQAEKANEMNDKLFAQNEELQKMNDRQFQIANQEWYPLLFPEDAIALRDRGEKHIALVNKRMDEISSRSTFQMSRIWYCNDPTNKGITKKEFFVKLNLLLKNDSKSKISRIKLYKIVSCEPYDDLLRDYNNVEREGVLFANDKFCLEIEINHHMQEFFQKSEQEYGLFFEIETITGVKFYQKIVLSDGHCSDGKMRAEVKRISNERIEE